MPDPDPYMGRIETNSDPQHNPNECACMQILTRNLKNKEKKHLIKILTGEYNVLEELAADAARPHHEQPGLPDPGLQVSGQHTLKLSHLQTLPVPNSV
jgi:hypothetical protein